MAGCLHLPVLVGLLLGLIQLRILLMLGWRVLWVLTLMVFVGNGLFLIVFLQIWRPLAFRMILTFGLMAVMSWMSCPGLVLEAAGFIPAGLGLAGLDVDGGHLDLLLPYGNLSLECCALFDSVLGPLQSVQRAELWRLSLPCSALLLFIWELIISTSSVMFLVFWMVVLVAGLL